MGGSGFSRMKENARETLLSSDLNRIQSLSSREAQNLLADAQTDDSGVPITALSGPCSLTGIAAQFNMALSAQQAFCYDPSDPSLTADDSPYEVARWAAQNLLFANPNGSNPRIDLVVVTPAQVDSDSQSRNILVDPVARTVTPQAVFKLTNPLCVPAVVTGTAAANPVPPAIPAGAFALAEVWVPAAVADSTSFVVLPRMWRRAPFPLDTMNGIVQGMRLAWDLSADPASTASIMVAAPDRITGPTRHRILIDGELLDFGVTGDPTSDAGGANPFGSAASAGWNRPYYVYAVGGRHAPQAALFGASPSPIAIVESTTPPNGDGHPSAAITPPRGAATQLGAVYVGLGFVAAGTTRRLACIMDDTWTHIGYGNFLVDLESVSHTSGGTTYEAFDVNVPMQLPQIARKALVAIDYAGTGAVDVVTDEGGGAAPPPSFVGAGNTGQLHGPGGGAITSGTISLPLSLANPKIWVQTGQAGQLARMVFKAFEHRVPRISGLR